MWTFFLWAVLIVASIIIGVLAVLFEAFVLKVQSEGGLIISFFVVAIAIGFFGHDIIDWGDAEAEQAVAQKEAAQSSEGTKAEANAEAEVKVEEQPSWFSKLAARVATDGPHWLLCIALFAVPITMFCLWHNDNFEELTTLLLGEVFVVALLFTPAGKDIATLFSWILVVGAIGITLLIIFEHPHIASLLFVGVIASMHFSGEWDVLEFARSNQQALIALAAAWLLCGLFEAGFEWDDIEEGRAKTALRLEREFYNTHKLEVGAAVPDDLAEAAEHFAVRNWTAINPDAARNHLSRLLKRAPYGPLPIFDRLLTTFVPKTWNLMVDLYVRGEVNRVEAEGRQMNAVTMNVVDTTKEDAADVRKESGVTV